MPDAKAKKTHPQSSTAAAQPSDVVVVSCAIDTLKPYERNPRKNDGAVPRMVASIKEFGFRVPILALSDGSVIDGHLRLKAAAELGIKNVPAILCDDWTPAQVKAFRLLVNRSVNWADWDTDLLKVEMADLQAMDFNLGLTGFDTVEIDNLFQEKDTAAADAAPDVPVHPITKPGDVWLLGKHRLMCGDSTVLAEVEKLLCGATPTVMVTDPPYGVNYDPEWRDGVDLGVGKRSTGKVHNDDRADWTAAYELFRGDVAYVWHASMYASTVAAGLQAAGFGLRSQIIWVKQHFVISRGHYHWQHEACLYAVRKTAHWTGDRKQTTVWNHANNNAFGNPTKEQMWGHGTQKPIDCMRRPIRNHTARGDGVYEPFSGSGTTIIAAESIERVCYAMEIVPGYVDAAVNRWQELTGQKATLEGRATPAARRTRLKTA